MTRKKSSEENKTAEETPTSASQQPPVVSPTRRIGGECNRIMETRLDNGQKVVNSDHGSIVWKWYSLDDCPVNNRNTATKLLKLVSLYTTYSMYIWESTTFRLVPFMDNVLFEEKLLRVSPSTKMIISCPLLNWKSYHDRHVLRNYLYLLQKN